MEIQNSTFSGCHGYGGLQEASLFIVHGNAVVLIELKPAVPVGRAQDSYVFCLLMMRRLNIPWYMTGIILASLVVSIICIAVNLKWKLSEHMAGMGGVIGGLISFSALFGYNPVGWLCLFILIAGILGSARIVLGHHTLGEVLSGFAVGLICALLVLHPVSNILFRVFLF